MNEGSYDFTGVTDEDLAALTVALDSQPFRGVNLVRAKELVERNDPDELVAVGGQWIFALADELAITRRSVQRLADRLDETMATHHRDEHPCDRYCDAICQVADDLRGV